MKWKTIAVLWTVLMVLIVLAGVAFHFIEGSQEEETRQGSRDAYARILANNPCLTEAELDALLEVVIRAYDQGVLETSNSSSSSNWDVASAIFFSTTISTTIGYGHISPSTRGGKVLCVFFALISIPVCLVVLSGLGGKINEGFQKLDSKLANSNDCCGKHPKVMKSLRTLLIYSIVFVLFILFPALIFWSVEGWSYADSAYYAFITLTTVGFGDFVAGQNTSEYSHRAVYRLCLSFWIIFGLAALSFLISASQDMVAGLVDKAEVSAERQAENGEAEKSEKKMEVENVENKA